MRRQEAGEEEGVFCVLLGLQANQQRKVNVSSELGSSKILDFNFTVFAH